MHCCSKDEGEKRTTSNKDGREKQAVDHKEEENKGKKAGVKEYLIAALVVALLVFAVTTAAQVNQLKKGSSQSEGSQGAETYEEMMARMHPEQAAASSRNSMAGGC